MWVTFASEDGSMSERLEVSGEMQVTELKELLSAIFGIPPTQQVFVCGGKELGTSGTIASLGIKDNDFVLIVNTGNRTGGRGGGRSPTAVVGSGTGAGTGAGAGRGGGGADLDRMDLREVFQQHTNPQTITRLIRSSENLMKQLQFHNPELAAQMGKDEATALRALRGFMMMNTTAATLMTMEKGQVEERMKQRLAQDENDPEAKKYFEKKNQEAALEEHYKRTLEEFPESFAPVLMLYIQVEINGTALQAFVDSGAQTSVISGRCAERCGLTPHIDGRFAGKVVGVGNGRTLGRVLYTNMTIEGNYFPISLTVMDDSQGLGDKNMEFLLGLDMLKRHQCSIDLVNGKLFFNYQGQQKSTPFLHEKDLPKTKGGTKDFDPNHDVKQ